MFEMDEEEHTADEPADVSNLLEETAGELLYRYEDIQRRGSPELKRAAEIVLGAYAPGGKLIKESESA